MVSGQRLTVTLEGGSPWGFRLQGGGNFPLEVAKIRKKSHAHKAGLQEGDVVLSINGIQLPGKSHQSAMDLVDMASSNITMEVSRSGIGVSATLDPQRQPRAIIPVVSDSDNKGPGVLSSATANFSTVDGNTRRDVHTEEVQMKGSSGKKITKTVTEERITRFNKSPVMWQPQGQEQGQGQSQLQIQFSNQQQHQGSHLEPARSPVMWQTQRSSPVPQEPSQTWKPPSRSPVPQQEAPQTWQPPIHSPVPQQQATPTWQPPSRSPVPQQQAPQKWQPPSRSPVPYQEAPQTWQPPSRSPVPQQHAPPTWQPPRHSPIPPPVKPKPVRSSSVPPAHMEADSYQHMNTKENMDPDLMAEQVKDMARHGPPSVPKFSIKQFGGAPTGQGRGPVAPRNEDPMYPMFEVFKPSWQPNKLSKPADPRGGMDSSSPHPYAGHPYTGADVPHTEAVSPMVSPRNSFIPPPPPMPPSKPAPSTQFPSPKKFRPGFASTPNGEYMDDPMHDGANRPDHLPVFAPRMTISLEDDSGYPLSPSRGDGLELVDEGSDLSSLGLAQSNESEEHPFNVVRLISFFNTIDQAPEKLFSDSTFYDDPIARYPTIKEQMSMCKLIAKSLTSAANRRAKGARMFAKRKRKSTRWIHEGYHGFGSEYSSSAGDVADLNDLDSELYDGEGGSKPLFSFRIPKIAAQYNEPTQKMSLSKDEFERLRLTGSRCEHQNVSPNMCFSIAADLQSSKNRGAKLFQKRQARSDKWVIDESNARRAPPSPTKLDQLRGPPQPSPWDSAMQGNTSQVPSYATLPKMHKLQPISQVTKIGGEDFNLKARGWGGSSRQVHQTQYRELGPLEVSITDSTVTTETSSPIPQGRGMQQQQYVPSANMDSPEPPNQSAQFGDYNRKMKAWPGSQQTVTTTQRSYSQSQNEQYSPRQQQYGGTPKPFQPQQHQQQQQHYQQQQHWQQQQQQQYAGYHQPYMAASDL